MSNYHITKYHITYNGPKPCKDKTGRCPYSQSSDPHFDSLEHSQKYYKNKMIAKFGNTESFKKDSTKKDMHSISKLVSSVRSQKSVSSKYENRLILKPKLEIHKISQNMKLSPPKLSTLSAKYGD